MSVLIRLLFVSLVAVTLGAQKSEVVYQVSTLDALTSGIYDGAVSIRQLRRHGSFGLGAFDALDGEMVVLDGRFYQIRTDGVAVRAEEHTRTPFAAVTDFEPDLRFSIGQPANFAQLAELIDKALPSLNLFYAVRVHGRFIEMTARSVPPQSKPYPPLAQALLNQQIFNFSHVSGTLVGFRCPQFVRGINLPGFHFHFLTEDKTRGGHALAFVIQEAEVEIDVTDGHAMALPRNKSFLDAVLPLP